MSKEKIEFLDMILANRGITDVTGESLLYPKLEYPSMLLNNMKEAVDLFHSHMIKGTPVYIQVDNDADGFTSSSLMYRFIREVFPKIEIKVGISDGKFHGIDIDNIPLSSFVIVPDAGSNDIEEHKLLESKGMDVLVLDHHIIEHNSPYAVVVNCQDGNYPNKALSGVGVAYKFIKAYCDKYKVDYNILPHMDLVTVGMLADSMSTLQEETRKLMKMGMNFQTPYFRYLLDVNKYTNEDTLDFDFIYFRIAPLINAVTRVGTVADKQMLFDTMNSNDRELIEANAIKIELLKEIQDLEVSNAVTAIKEKLTDRDLSHKILAIPVDSEVRRTLTGLIANQIAEYYYKPTLIIRKYENEWRGSGRTIETGIEFDFKSIIGTCTNVKWARGHEGAFGICTECNKIEEILAEMDNKLSHINFTKPDPDFETTIASLKARPEAFKFLKEMKKEWGFGLREPVWKINNISSPIEVIGQKENTLRIRDGKLTIVQFCVDNAVEISSKMTTNVSVIGTLTTNVFMGRETPQVIAKEIIVVDEMVMF